MAKPPPDVSPAAILTNVRDAVVAMRTEVLWAELQALPGALRVGTPHVATARDALRAAINLAVDHGVSSSCTDETPRALTTTSIDRRLGPDCSVDALVAAFAAIVEALRPLLAKAHLGEVYRRRKKSLQAYSQARRLGGTSISPEAVLDQAFTALLENDELLRSWAFQRDEEINHLLRERVDNEGHNRQRRRGTRKSRFQHLAPSIAGSGGPRRDAPSVDWVQAPSQEVSMLAEELLTCLTPLDRQIVEMRVAGFSNVEIGRELDIYRKTVPARYERACWKMRAVLEGKEDPEAAPDPGGPRGGEC